MSHSRGTGRKPTTFACGPSTCSKTGLIASRETVTTSPFRPRISLCESMMSVNFSGIGLGTVTR